MLLVCQPERSLYQGKRRLDLENDFFAKGSHSFVNESGGFVWKIISSSRQERSLSTRSSCWSTETKSLFENPFFDQRKPFVCQRPPSLIEHRTLSWERKGTVK